MNLTRLPYELLYTIISLGGHSLKRACYVLDKRTHQYMCLNHPYVVVTGIYSMSSHICHTCYGKQYECTVMVYRNSDFDWAIKAIKQVASLNSGNISNECLRPQDGDDKAIETFFFQIDDTNTVNLCKVGHIQRLMSESVVAYNYDVTLGCETSNETFTLVNSYYYSGMNINLLIM